MAILTDRVDVDPSSVGLEIDTTGGIWPPFGRPNTNSSVEVPGTIPDEILEKIMPVCQRAQNLTVYISDDPGIIPQFRNIINEIDTSQVTIHTCVSGVPVNPELVEYCIDNNVRYLSLSLNSAVVKSSRKLYRTNLEGMKQTLAAISGIKQARGVEHPIIHLNTVYTRNNYKRLPQLVDLAHDLGVQRIMLHTVLPETVHQPDSADSKENVALEQESSQKISKYDPAFRKKHGKLISESREYNLPITFADQGMAPCVRPWQSVHISRNGYMAPCSFTVNSEYTTGNLAEHSFNEIRNNDEFQEMRREMAERRLPGCCLDCVFYNDNKFKFYYNQR
jgi:radical SAM protein with 4Fe4S-binding SPASM domain